MPSGEGVGIAADLFFEAGNGAKKVEKDLRIYEMIAG